MAIFFCRQHDIVHLGMKFKIRFFLTKKKLSVECNFPFVIYISWIMQTCDSLPSKAQKS
uniref:Uncharacterized protein n=1 Tax=Anguilla anguilla TaxID=7936 RepID=A0A0E9WIX4_ANGAN